MSAGFNSLSTPGYCITDDFRIEGTKTSSQYHIQCIITSHQWLTAIQRSKLDSKSVTFTTVTLLTALFIYALIIMGNTHWVAQSYNAP